MTPLEWIGLTNLVIIPALTWVWKEFLRPNIEDGQLKTVLDTGIRAAEELSARGALGEGVSKEAFVLDLARTKLPKNKVLAGMSEKDMEVLIASLCQAAGVGASGKPEIQLPLSAK